MGEDTSPCDVVDEVTSPCDVVDEDTSPYDSACEKRLVSSSTTISSWRSSRNIEHTAISCEIDLTMPIDATTTEVGSYFISNYPPYSQWKPEFLPEVERAMADPPRPVPLGLYLHIPFCRKRCKFCYFKVFTGKNSGEIEPYVEALCREIELVSQQAVMGDRPFRFVYFGGGTPSFLSPKQLTSLVDRLRANISWDKAEEVTFECEPGTLSESKVHTLRELGVTRLSLGIENFDDAILEENGRAHLSK